MITEETLLARWRKLNSIKKEKVLEFLESLEKSEPRENYYQPLLDSLDLFSDDFMETREQSLLEKREDLFP
jgi:hypothetical protein